MILIIELYIANITKVLQLKNFFAEIAVFI